MDKCCICSDQHSLPVFGWTDPRSKACVCPCQCEKGKKENSHKIAGKLCSCCPDGSAKPYNDTFFNCPCTCEDGTDSILINNKCDCELCQPCDNGYTPNKTRDGSCGCNKCGSASVCSEGRRGYNCDESKCKDQTCSGNGKCISTSETNCSAACECNENFEGENCENRVPRRNHGDPHLETLDGRSFDYFGIGQFIGCISKHLAYQMRFFAYQRTSFIGQIAIKVGNSSVLTITTNSKSSARDLPTLRLNGEILNINIENRMHLLFDNETIRMDLSITPQDIQENDPSILMITVKYANGASLGIAASYSSPMKRQYLSLVIVPVNDMINKTSGLCGYMNDDPRDDFLGADGKNYTDPFLFVETYRMSLSIRVGGGLQNSWSDELSNFHENDSIDQSYNDFTHKPLISLSGFSQQIINKAKDVCSKAQLSDLLKDQCVFDVVVTDDDSMSKQNIFQSTLCLKKCSFRGNCVNGTCKCIDGWSGPACDYGSCGKCDKGNCEGGFCKCIPGFVGAACNEIPICEGNCSGKGICIDTDVCHCDDGWTSSNCSEEAVCLKGCSDRGVCVDHDMCKCETGYNNSDCSGYTCEQHNRCSGNGICIPPGGCVCLSGWQGLSCSKPICDNNCFNYGVCTAPNTCECYPGYSGVNCNNTDSCPKVNNCSGNGICVGSENCVCNWGYKGVNCSQPICEVSCGDNGRCIQPNQCKCSSGYTGELCREFSCKKYFGCSNHGKCLEFDKCFCDEFWLGDSCNVPSCKNLSDCSNNGDCISANECMCNRNFDGEDCSKPVVENKNYPIFLRKSYSAVVSEFTVRGEVILIIQANDTDSGKAGSIRYSIVKSELELIINQISGDIIVDGPLTPGEYVLRAEASDYGIPPLRSFIDINITVVDINECAVIEKMSDIAVSSYVPYNSVVGKIIATDPDIGLFGNLSYDISINGYDGEDVGVTIKNDTNEIITTKNPLRVGRYQVVVYSFDKSEKPCTASSTININIVPSYIKVGDLEGKENDKEIGDETTTFDWREILTPKIDTTEIDQTSVFTSKLTKTPSQSDTSISQATKQPAKESTTKYAPTKSEKEMTTAFKSDENTEKEMTESIIRFTSIWTTEEDMKERTTNSLDRTKNNEQRIKELQDEVKLFKILTFTFSSLSSTLIILMVIILIKYFNSLE